MAYGDGPKSFSLMAMPAMRASRLPVVISRTGGLDRRLFGEAEAR